MKLRQQLVILGFKKIIKSENFNELRNNWFIIDLLYKYKIKGDHRFLAMAILFKNPNSTLVCQMIKKISAENAV